MTRPQRKILLVDNEPTRRLMLEKRLRALDVGEILYASDGSAALTVCKDRCCSAEDAIDLVITDLATEPVDGLGLLRGLADCGMCSPPPLAIVGAMDETIRRATSSLARALRYPFVGFIRKPITDGGLRRVLDSARVYRSVHHRPHAVAGMVDFTIGQIEAGLAAGQFVPYFQPKIALEGTALHGIEALARWDHPDHGIIAPDRYVPLLEATGKIHCLTDAIARQSIEYLARFRQSGIHASVSINLSLSQLQHYDIVSRLQQLCQANGVPHHRVMIEITETAHIRNVAATLETLCRLRLKGFGLSLDDFGTGYSSIQNLDILPINELKIDKSFIGDICINPLHRQLVEAVVAIGHNLGIQVVAEGVETAAHYHRLVEMGCDAMQGYYFSRAVPGARLIEQYGRRVAYHGDVVRLKRASLCARPAESVPGYGAPSKKSVNSEGA